MKKAKKKIVKRELKKFRKKKLTARQYYSSKQTRIETWLTGIHEMMVDIRRNQLVIARSMAPLIHDLRMEHKKQKGVYTIGNRQDLLDLQKLIDEGAKKVEIHSNG